MCGFSFRLGRASLDVPLNIEDLVVGCSGSVDVSCLALHRVLPHNPPTLDRATVYTHIGAKRR